MLINWLFSAFLSITFLPAYDEAIVDVFDQVEVNHFHDSNGGWVFDQIIWRSLNKRNTQEIEYRVEAWRLIKDRRGKRPKDKQDKLAWDADPKNAGVVFIPEIIGIDPVFPRANKETGKYESVFFDNGILRKVTANIKVESWTQHDPELLDREKNPKEKRRELSLLRKVE